MKTLSFKTRKKILLIYREKKPLIFLFREVNRSIKKLIKEIKLIIK